MRALCNMTTRQDVTFSIITLLSIHVLTAIKLRLNESKSVIQRVKLYGIIIFTDNSWGIKKLFDQYTS
jgi:hypothetical protein